MLEKDLFSTVDLFESKDMNSVILSLFNLGGTIQSTIPYFTGPKIGIKQANRNFQIVPPLEVPVVAPVVAPITDPEPVVIQRSPVVLDPLPAVPIPEDPRPPIVVAATTAALPASPAAAISMAVLVKQTPIPPVAPEPVPRHSLPGVVSSVLSPPIKAAVSAIQATVASIPSSKALPKLLSPPRSPPAAINHRETLPSSVKPPPAPPAQPSNLEMDIKPRKRTALSSKLIINATKSAAVAQSQPSPQISQQQLPSQPPSQLIHAPQVQMPPMQVHPAALGSYQSYGSHLLRQVSTQQPVANRSFGAMSQVAPSYVFQQPQPRPQRKHVMPRDESEEAVVIATMEWIECVIFEARHPSLSLYSWLASGEILCRLANVVLGASPNPHIRISGIARASDSAVHQKENSKKFVDICRLVGLAEADLFTPSDLQEGRNLGKVIRCVATLGGVLQNYEWWVNSPFAQLGRRIRIQSVVKV